MNYLFVCKSNVGRSQIASAFFNVLAIGSVSKSAGTHVLEKEGQYLHEHVLTVMREIGYDLSKQKRTQLTPGLANASNKIIVMLDDHSDLPDYVQIKNVEFWEIPDAKDTSLEFHRQIRDMIQGRVKELIVNLHE